MTLDVLISTCGSNGIERVAQMQLPQVDGVAYIVSWQLTDDDTSIGRPSSVGSRMAMIRSRF